MGCTFLAAGSLDPAEVIESTSSGVYVRRMESAGQNRREKQGRLKVRSPSIDTSPTLDNGGKQRAKLAHGNVPSWHAALPS